MPFGIHVGRKHNTQPNPTWTELPTASDGHELYIQKLLACSGVLGRDDFQRTQPGGGKGNGRGKLLDNIVKWGGVVFAGALGFMGLKNFMGRRAAKAAQTAAKTVAS